MRNISSSKSSEKNLENQRSINTQTLKILRIRISETMQIVSEFIRAEEFLSKNSEAICGKSAKQIYHPAKAGFSVSYRLNENNSKVTDRTS